MVFNRVVVYFHEYTTAYPLNTILEQVVLGLQSYAILKRSLRKQQGHFLYPSRDFSNLLPNAFCKNFKLRASLNMPADFETYY